MGLAQLLFGFHGRIRRTNYWLGTIGAGFVLGLIATVVVLLFVGGAALISQNGAGASQAAGAGVGIVGILLYIVILVLGIWIGLALQVKRWHDRDKSGAWVLIGFIPIVGPIWVLIECGFLDGTPGPNRYGPSPKGITGPPPAQPTS